MREPHVKPLRDKLLGNAHERERRDCAGDLCARAQATDRHPARIRQEDAENAAGSDPSGAEARKGVGAMTIPFKKVKAAWLKDAEFRAEYERPKQEYARGL